MPRVPTSSLTPASSARETTRASEQVDDGPYRIVDENTVVIGDPGVTFHYKITNDDNWMLDPVLPDCALQGCLEAASSVSVALPGRTWKRVSEPQIFIHICAD